MRKRVEQHRGIYQPESSNSSRVCLNVPLQSSIMGSIGAYSPLHSTPLPSPPPLQDTLDDYPLQDSPPWVQSPHNSSLNIVHNSAHNSPQNSLQNLPQNTAQNSHNTAQNSPQNSQGHSYQPQRRSVIQSVTLSEQNLRSRSPFRASNSSSVASNSTSCLPPRSRTHTSPPNSPVIGRQRLLNVGAEEIRRATRTRARPVCHCCSPESPVCGANPYINLHPSHLNNPRMSTLSNPATVSIPGNGGCLYAVAAYFLYSDPRRFLQLRKLSHAFLVRNYWNMTCQGMPIDYLIWHTFPRNFTISGTVRPKIINTPEQWLNFLTTDKSLKTFTEIEIETQSLANFLDVPIRVFSFSISRNISYWVDYVPDPLLSIDSPFRGSWNLPCDMLVYHEIDSHFSPIVVRP